MKSTEALATEALAEKRARRAAYMREYNRRRIEADPSYKDRLYERAGRWATRNPDKAKQVKRKHAEANRVAIREKNRAYKLANPEKDRQAKLNYVKNNPHKMLANCRLRQATKASATPSWANLFFIEEAYHLAKVRSSATGLKWEVDHIVPLRSKIVCGLHVEHNLAVIPRKLNQAKGNRWWPNMPGEYL
jgi:hypothetical protein